MGYFANNEGRKKKPQLHYIEELRNFCVTAIYRSERGLPFTPKDILQEVAPKKVIRHHRWTEYFLSVGWLLNSGGHGPNGDMEYRWVGPQPVTRELILERLLPVIDAVDNKNTGTRKAKKAPPAPPPATPIEAAIQDGGIIATHHPQPPKETPGVPQNQRYAFLVGELHHLRQVQESILTVQQKVLEELSTLRQAYYRGLDALSDLARPFDEVNQKVSELHNQLK